MEVEGKDESECNTAQWNFEQLVRYGEPKADVIAVLEALATLNASKLNDTHEDIIEKDARRVASLALAVSGKSVRGPVTFVSIPADGLALAKIDCRGLDAWEARQRVKDMTEAVSMAIESGATSARFLCQADDGLTDVSMSKLDDEALAKLGLQRLKQVESRGYVGLSLVTEEWMETAFASTDAAPPDSRLYVSVVVGGGVYRERTVASLFRVYGQPERTSESPMRLEFVRTLISTSQPDGINDKLLNALTGIEAAKVIVDGGGLGSQVAKFLTVNGIQNVETVLWGSACQKEPNKSRFYNLRAQCNIHASEALADRRLVLGAVPVAHRAPLTSQARDVLYSFDSEARFRLASKEDAHNAGVASSDLWDTIAMAFLESAQ